VGLRRWVGRFFGLQETCTDRQAGATVGSAAVVKIGLRAPERAARRLWYGGAFQTNLCPGGRICPSDQWSASGPGGTRPEVGAVRSGTIVSGGGGVRWWMAGGPPAGQHHRGFGQLIIGGKFCS